MAIMVSEALTCCMTIASSRYQQSRRHAFRATLPTYKVPKAVREPMPDGQLFLMTFVAAFLAFYGFLA